MSFEYDPPTGLLDTSVYPDVPASPTAARQQFMDLFYQARDQIGILSSFAVNVKSFGAKGDGVTDDTNAIIAALEYANGITAGTWETSGDTVSVKRKRTPVFLPPGEYRTTRTIPINFSGVSLHGALNDTEGSMEWSGFGSIILADHNSNVFSVNTNYYSYSVSIKNIGIRKKSPYAGQGHGISVTGTNWTKGLSFRGVSIRDCNNGINIATGSVTVANVWVEQCDINANYGYGFYSSDHITIGRIEKNNITQNALGGIYTAGKGIAIMDNDLEGQPKPLTVTGSNNEKINIERNYFEQHSSGNACIEVSLTHGIIIENNEFTSNITIPLVQLSDCTNGQVDEYPILKNCNNIRSRYGYKLPSTDSFALGMNLSCLEVPVYGADTISGAVTFGSSSFSALIGHKRYKADFVDNTYRAFYTSGTFNFTTGDYVAFAFVIKYTNTLPLGQNQVLVFGRNSANATYESITTVSFDVTTNIKIGDSVLFIGGLKIADVKTFNSLRLYVYPYNSDTTIGNGAYVTKIAAFKPSNPEFNKFNPLSIIDDNSYSVRPTNPREGESVFDSVLGKPIWNVGGVWKDATGTTV